MIINAPMTNSPIAGAVIPAGLSLVFAGIAVPAPSNLQVGSLLTLQSVLSPMIRAGVTVTSPILDTVTNGVVVDYDLLSYTPVDSGWFIAAPMADNSVVVSTGSYLLPDPTGALPNGIPLLRAEVEAVEGNYGWVGTFTLENPADLVKFTPLTAFTFHLGNDVYSFIVDGRSYSATEHVSRTATVKGISGAVQLTAPRVPTVTKTWAVPKMSHDIIQEMANGYPVQINILNWAIPANRYGVSDVDPLSVIKEIATAVGGVLDSLQDGTLRVRYKYPYSVPTWGPAVVNHTYYGDVETFMHVDNDEPVKVYDKFRIMDARVTEGGDKLEYKELGTGRGEVRAYPSPYRYTCYLDSSSYSVYIGPVSEEYRTEKEIIEIYAGEGTTRYPVVSVTSLRWIEHDLLGVIAGNDSTKIISVHPTDQYSLVEIEYVTRCLLYPVIGQVGTSVQFLLRNV